MSFLALLRSLDARAIGIAFAIGYLASIPVAWLLGVLAFAFTSDAILTSDIQSRFGLAAWFAAPFLGGFIAGRWARQVPILSGSVVAVLGTTVQVLLMEFTATWMLLAMILFGLVAGVLGAIVGRACRAK